MTTDWTSGYVADIGYTFGYYNELNPLRAKLALLNAGIAAPEINHPDACHCELGFGQGLSANIHAAASATTWYANDFNPAQAAFAQTLAKASGAKSYMTDQSFEEFCSRSDLPEFDSIGLHGIWSWISDHNRSIIVDFVRRKLKVGGVLYVSYNTLPGWSTFAPLRHLMTQHSKVMGSEGMGIVKRVDNALNFINGIVESDSLFAKANPQVKPRLDKIKEQDRHYLAHEYFNQDWQPMYFSDMAKWLEAAKLNFGCSAHYMDHIDVINLKSEHLLTLKDIQDPVFKETVKDFLVNQQFRRDYWIKGSRSLSILEKSEALRSTEVVLFVPEEEVLMKVNGALGEASLSLDVYKPILKVLSDHQQHSVRDIENKVELQGVTFVNLIQAIIILTGAGHIAEAQPIAQQQAALNSCRSLNRHLMITARSNAEINYLASPITGGGILVSRFHKLFLLAMLEGYQNSEDWAQFAWNVLKVQGQRLLKDGKALETPEENLEELMQNAIEFENKRLPIFKALKIC
jgi:hypothetical protein